MVSLWLLLRLNLATTPDYYPLPNIQDLSSRLHGCSIFTKLDLRKGYYQIPVQEGDIHKMAIITPFGLWEFLTQQVLNGQIGSLKSSEIQVFFSQGKHRFRMLIFL